MLIVILNFRIFIWNRMMRKFFLIIKFKQKFFCWSFFVVDVGAIMMIIMAPVTTTTAAAVHLFVWSHQFFFLLIIFDSCLFGGFKLNFFFIDLIEKKKTKNGLDLLLHKHSFRSVYPPKVLLPDKIFDVDKLWPKKDSVYGSSGCLW